jgi:predicted DNA-binding protein (MmcQ/YjbR family)
MVTRRTGKRSDSGDEVLARLRATCLAFPETSETGSWGHPNFRAGKLTFVTYEIVDSKPSIAFRLEPDEVSEFLVMKGFFPTPYGRGAWVSLDATRRVSWRLVEALIEKSYRGVALKRMIDRLDSSSRESGIANSALEDDDR